MKHLFIFIILFFAQNSKAEVSFHYSPSAQWEEKVSQVIQKVEDILPNDWPTIGHCQIYYVKNSDASYRPIFRYTNSEQDIVIEEKLLVLSSDEPEIIAHEYAHFLLDDYMRQRVPAWKHFFILSRYMANNATESLASSQKTLQQLQSTLQEFENDPENTLSLDRLKKSITKTKQKIIDLSEAMEIEKLYNFSLYDVNSFKAMAPYYELHADTLAAIALNDWNSMSRIMEKNINNPKMADLLVLPEIEPKEKAIAAYINSRRFLDDLDPSTYIYQAWESKGNYFQFAPTRSKIKWLVETKYNSDKNSFIATFTNALMDVYELSILSNPKSLEKSLKEKNIELVKLIEN